MENIIHEEKVQHYFQITGMALEKANITIPKNTAMHNIAEDYKDMAKRYYDDAKSFYNQGNYVLAYGALNYAHAWLDAGARIGLFDVGYDDKLFTVDRPKDNKNTEETTKVEFF